MSRGINLRAVSNFKRPLFICMSDSLDSFSNEEYIGVLLFWKVSWDFQNFNDSYNMRKRGNNKNNDNNNNNNNNNKIKLFSRVCCVWTLWSTSGLPWAPYLLLSSSTLPYSTLYPQLEIIWFKPLNTTTRVLCRYSSGNLNSSVLKGIESLPQTLVHP